jgi:4-hydroxybenzoate polyprenyltransferase
MEIRALSNSIIAELGQYLRTRLMLWRIVALLLLLTATSVAASIAVPSPETLVLQAAFLLLAVSVFRLWDDLADRDFDRVHHPGRVPAESNRLLPYVVAIALGLAVLAFLLRDDLVRVAVLLAYAMILALVYHSAIGRRMSRPLRAGVVLAKYPLFVLLLVATADRAWIASVALLLVLAVHEWRSDSDLRRPGALELLAELAPGTLMLATLHLLSGVLP